MLPESTKSEIMSARWNAYANVLYEALTHRTVSNRSHFVLTFQPVPQSVRLTSWEFRHIRFRKQIIRNCR